ncbi:Rv1157c family protein [Williamsia deligens]|uniref:Uncharacterized protein n=1 Tax=Williamsia deligens TaxID=321325 RepID=A0ABW3G1B0_9NOCA|nr:hypothetical protein [Williamsia deligens]
MLGTTALGVLTAMTVPAVAFAAPAPSAPAPSSTSTLVGSLPLSAPSAPKIDKATLNSLGAFLPAIVGSAATPGPDGKINGDLISQATAIADSPGMPPQVSTIWRQVTGFLDGSAQPKQVAKVAAAANDPVIPTGPNAPRIQQFLYPTIGVGCIPGGNSVGTALVTAGPQEAPAPGPRSGQAGYVYTSLGTGPALNNTRAPLTAIWINIDNGRTGQITLTRNEKINTGAGPGTFTAIAQTGKGRVLSAIYGTVTTRTKGKTVACQIVPTVGLAYI